MSVHRNGIGQIKRTEGNRSVRRMHLQGVVRLVKEGRRPVTSFKGRTLAFLNRLYPF